MEELLNEIVPQEDLEVSRKDCKAAVHVKKICFRFRGLRGNTTKNKNSMERSQQRQNLSTS